MFDTNNSEHGLLFACLHNLNMFTLLVVTREGFGNDYGFIDVGGKYPFPDTLPTKAKAYLGEFMKGAIIFVPMGGTKSSKLVLPERNILN